ncbi:MAG: Nif3-like dinuclear metal center hexameric protein [Actinomycetota bacterium]
MTTPRVRLADVLDGLEQLYPAATAASWDAVGLVCGDADDAVAKVLFAVDPTEAVVDEALEWGADLLVSHHPLLLRAVHGVGATSAKGRLVHRLIRGGCALFVAHTNADAASPGVSDALARTIGLRDLQPLAPQSFSALDKIVVTVPDAAADRLVDALAAAGAGSVGSYARAAFRSTGTGTFVPGPGAWPAVGAVGEIAVVAETRVEMVLARRHRGAVVRALRAAHPYEQPAFDVLELVDDPAPSTGLGRVGDLPEPVTLERFAQHVATVLPNTVGGVRAAGDPAAIVQRVAVCGGAGDDLFDAVRASGADVFVTADLRHHPASEAREHARGGAPYLVDVSHWASEWPWLAGGASRLESLLATTSGQGQTTTVEVRVSTTRTDPWTLHVPSRGSTP